MNTLFYGVFVEGCTAGSFYENKALAKDWARLLRRRGLKPKMIELQEVTAAVGAKIRIAKDSRVRRAAKASIKRNRQAYAKLAKS